VEPGVKAWLLLGYNENLHVMNNPSLYSHDGRLWRELREGRVTERAGVFPVFAHRPNALHTDGEEHSRLRSAIVDSLGQLTEVQVRKNIGDLANRLIDSFAANGTADLIGEYASQLPLLAVNRFFGLDNDQGYLLVKLMSELWDGEGDTAVAANQKLEQYMFELVELKRREPGADIATWMLAHRAELTDEEAAQQLMLILAAAHDPTTNLIGNAMRVLLTDHTLRYELASGQVLLQETIDQVLWIDPPLQTLAARFATQDLRVGDVRVRAGDALILGFAAANSDPALSGSPGEPGGAGGFTAFATNRAHLAWGAGPHRCPAQDIARMIAEAGIEALAQRLMDLRLAVPENQLRWRPSLFVRGLVSLPVRFIPEQTPDSLPSDGDPAWFSPQPSPSSSTPTPETSKAKQRSSANKAPLSRWNFLARWWYGR
jgi:cytochrome P450